MTSEKELTGNLRAGMKSMYYHAWTRAFLYLKIAIYQAGLELSDLLASVFWD